MQFKKDIDFLYEIGNLRYIDRIWKRFLNPDVANNAEHTFRVIWIALTIAKYEGSANNEKIMKMAIVHDIPESRVGDVDYVSRQYVKRNEELAIVDMLSGTILEDMTAIWKEYEKRECIEAKIVKDADTIDVEFEIMEQEARGHKLGEIWNKDRKENVYPKLFTETAKKLWEEIHESNPHDWHLLGRNRFSKGGDWEKKK